MRYPKPRFFPALCLTTAVALSMAAVAPAALAAATPDADEQLVTRWRVADVPPGTQELDELDEVMVRGQRAAILIADLEDDFYKRYNKLNKENLYDVNCAYVNTDPEKPGSNLRSRICMPVFVADAMQQWAEGRCEHPDFFSLDLNKDHSLSEAEAAGNRELLPQLYFLDTNHDRRISYTEFINRSEESTPQCYQPPTPEQVLMAGTDRWYRQMMKVTNSDPHLKRMSESLGELYGALRMLERHYGKLETEAKAQKVRR